MIRINSFPQNLSNDPLSFTWNPLKTSYINPKSYQRKVFCYRDLETDVLPIQPDELETILTNVQIKNS